MDGTTHAELLDHAGTDAANFVTNDVIAGLASQPSDAELQRVSIIKAERVASFSKIRTRRALPMILPLSNGQRYQDGLFADIDRLLIETTHRHRRDHPSASIAP